MFLKSIGAFLCLVLVIGASVSAVSHARVYSLQKKSNEDIQKVMEMHKNIQKSIDEEKAKP